MGKEDGVGDGWQEEEGERKRERGKGGEGRKKEGKDRRKQKKAGYRFKAWAHQLQREENM